MEYIPIAIGIALFCAGTLVALAIVWNKGPRLIGCLICAGSSVGLLPLFAILPPIHPTLESVSGRYAGSYAGGAETFELRTDGTFLQSYVRNGIALYSNRGTWKVEDRGVTFYNIMVAAGAFGDSKTPEHFDVSGGGLYLMRKQICFDIDGYRCIYKK